MGVYGFIFKKNRFDMLYLFYNLLVAISWSFYNGECVLTYWIKKYRNPKYVAGEESTNLEDMYLLIGSKEIVSIVMTIGVVLSPISFYIVFKRNQFPSFIYFPFCISFLMYNIILRILSAKIYPEFFTMVQNIFKVIFTSLFVLSLQFLYKKNNKH